MSCVCLDGCGRRNCVRVFVRTVENNDCNSGQPVTNGVNLGAMTLDRSIFFSWTGTIDQG
jgi:hypothetical protein